MKVPLIYLYHARKKEIGTGFYPKRRIEGFYDLKVKKDAEKAKDSFSFKVTNDRLYDGSSFDYSQIADFSQRDYVEIYAFYSDEYSGPSSDNFLIAGFIENVDYSVNESSATFDITGNTISEGLMNILVPAIFSSENEAKVDDILMTLINRANSTSGIQRKIKASRATVDSNGNRTGGGYIWPVKSNGDSFPIVSYHKNYSNLFEHLDELSKREYTEDYESGNYIFYIDNDDELHFEPKNKNIKFELDEYSMDYSLIEKTLSKDNMINVLLYNVGLDPNGNGIIMPIYNLRSVKKFGSKWKYKAQDRIAQFVKDTEAKRGPTINSGKEIGPSNYPILVGSPNEPGYPWTVSLSGGWGDQLYEKDVTEVNDNDEYKNYIRNISKFMGYKPGRNIVDTFGFPRANIKYEPELGTISYLPNDYIKINLKSIDFERNLRVMSVDHDFSDGWNTTIELAEDETTG